MTPLCAESLTRCSLVMSYGDINLSQDWPRWWLVAWRQQVNICTNVDLSLRSIGIHSMTIAQNVHQPSITKIRLKILYLKFYSYLPWGQWAQEFELYSNFLKHECVYTFSALEITPSNQQNTHDFADGHKYMNDIFNNYVCSASHMHSGPHLQNA